MVDLGVIERVDLRTVWEHEAQDFTPWLAANLDKLGEALGLELEFREQESAVGPFSLDILAHDLDSSRPVIIENQLEATNHDHLGKLLTYASGHDAYAAVWLVREFRDEHRQALDWLNQRTGEDTAFFGVVVEAWQIDGSRPAPHFRIVAAPNGWQKRTGGAARSSDGRAVSERGERYRQFFENLADALRDGHGFANIRQRRATNYLVVGSGVTGFRYDVGFPQGGKAQVQLSLRSSNNARQYDWLLERQESLEAGMGETLLWERREHRQDSRYRITVLRDGSIDDDPDALEEVQEWMVDRLLAFRRVFGPHLQELVELEG